MEAIQPTGPFIVPDMRFWDHLTDGLDDEFKGAWTDPLANLTTGEWLNRMFPDAVQAAMAERHEVAWEWAGDIEADSAPPEAVLVWPRKGGKTTTVELIVVMTLLRGSRRYWLYVCETQQQADDHVANIARLLERDTVKAYYPHHAERAVSKYKTSLGWNKTRLRTKAGGIVDSLGIFSAVRGLLIEGQPPDGCVLDDIDGLYDSSKATLKKERIVKNTVLPALTDNAAVIYAQNLILPSGCMSRLVNGRADYMVRRQVWGPYKAIEGLKTERVWDDDLARWRDIIVAGEATWEGQDLEACQRRIDRFGLQTFKEECQNEVEEREGALWTKAMLNETRVGVEELPVSPSGDIMLKTIVVAVDPSGGGDDIGIVAAGLGHDGHAYVLTDRTQPGPKGPHNWGRETAELFQALKANEIIGEKNYGGDLVRSNIRVHYPRAPVRLVTASRGKDVRADPIVSLWEEGLIHLVGSFPELETELTSWVPDESTESPNRLDAMVWALWALMLDTKRRSGRGRGSITVPT